MTRDPRSEAEKARADLARNAELGLAVPESPAEQQPSVTPETFGDTTENGRVIRDDQGRSGNEADRDISTSTCRSAIRCFRAWKEPIGRPNCTRSRE